MSVSPNETILETIERRLIPDDQAKKARGEVFTPLNLVREVLYGFRKSDLENGAQVPWGVDKAGNVVEDTPDNRIGGIPLEVWRDPDTKWLDPANGIGNFPFVAFYMLDFQLKNYGTKGSKDWTEEKRKRHIVENMLYMIELDRGNVNTSFKVMDFLVPGSKPHICCADALKLTDEDLKRHFGVSTFSVVMGNPPFNTPRSTKGQTTVLWDKFIVSMMKRVDKNGHFVFITPQVWRKPEHILFNAMTKDNQLVLLKILGETETQQEFHVGSRVDIYIIQMKPKDGESYIIDERGILNKIDVGTLPFIPSYLIKDIQSIITNDTDGIKVMHDRTMYGHDKKNVSKVKNDVFTLPVMNSMTAKGGNTLIYANADKGHFGVPKVILSGGRNQYPYNDYEGNYGLSDAVFGIPIISKTKEEGDLIVRAINTERFKEIIKATKWGTFQTEYKMFKYFRPDFYKEFLKKPEGGMSRRTRRKPR